MKEFKEHVVRTKYTTRRMFQHDVLRAIVNNKRLNGVDVQDHDQYQVVAFMQAHRLVPSHPTCHTCGVRYQMKIHRQKSRKSAFWCWNAPLSDCPTCGNRQRTHIMTGTLCENVHISMWHNWLDVFFMWSVDMPLPQIYAEYKAVKYDHIRRWINKFQDAAAHKAMVKITFAGLHRSLKLRPRRFKPTALKRPSAMKKPAGAMKRSVMKRKCLPKRKPVATYNKKLVVEVDEVFLNKGKFTRLSAGCRPKKSQLWLWGMVVPNRPDLFWYRLLADPISALDGKPRGTEEILQCLRDTGVPRNTIIVSDGWKATGPAIDRYRQQCHLGKTALLHEVVNHSEGIVVNENGFTTNHIELQWSLMKRWLRAKMGGRLPSTQNRLTWHMLI
eukprot:4738807-Amphidinium_carterae.1